MGSSVASSSASGTHEPERTCSFESNSSIQQSPVPVRCLFRGSSTSSFGGLSTASITSSPLVPKEVLAALASKEIRHVPDVQMQDTFMTLSSVLTAQIGLAGSLSG